MSTLAHVWPENKTPDKEQIERMYKCAYYLDRSFFVPADLADFGIDLVRLKEFGEVIMRKPLPALRQKTEDLWKRMNKSQRTMFFYSYFSQGARQLVGLIDHIEALIGNCMSERHALSSVQNTLHRKFPDNLQEKLRDGFGKEWST